VGRANEAFVMKFRFPTGEDGRSFLRLFYIDVIMPAAALFWHVVLGFQMACGSAGVDHQG
jgi:hypothetical protein